MTLTDAFVAVCAGHYLFVHPSSTSTLHANHPNPRVRFQFSDTLHNSDILHNMSVLSRVSRVSISHASCSRRCLKTISLRNDSPNSSKSIAYVSSSPSSPTRVFSEITRRRNDYLREMFLLLQRRNSAELVLTSEYPHGPDLEEFMSRFDISKAYVCILSLIVSLIMFSFTVRRSGASHNWLTANLPPLRPIFAPLLHNRPPTHTMTRQWPLLLTHPCPKPSRLRHHCHPTWKWILSLWKKTTHLSLVNCVFRRQIYP